MTISSNIALISICLAALMFGLEILSVPVILPILKKKLGATIGDMQWIMSAYVAKKWGKHLALEQGRIMRTPDGQSRMREAEPPQRQKGIER